MANPEAFDTITVYVPRKFANSCIGISPGSGIVGSPGVDGYVIIDFEGNEYHASNLVRYEDKVRAAADRHLARYPTVARRAVPEKDLVPVGVYSRRTGKIMFEVNNTERFEEWREGRG